MSPSVKPDELQSHHSEEVYEIVGQAPHGIVRYGISVLGIMSLILFGIGFLVKYTDGIKAPLTIIAVNTPKSVLTKMDGKVVRLFVKEGTSVEKDDILAYMESTASHEEIIRLSDILTHLQRVTNDGDWNALKGFRSAQFIHLGELQLSYQIFMQSFIQLQPYFKDGWYIQKKALITQDLKYTTTLKHLLETQLAIHEKDFEIARQDFAIKEQLYNEKVLPLLEYKQEESKLLNKQLPLENDRALIIHNAAAASAKQQELFSMEQEFLNRKSEFIQAMNRLINEVNKWQSLYLLKAPIAGVVTFVRKVYENQDMKSGQEFCYIAMPDEHYYGELLLPQENFGKVKLHQQVLIELPSYPYMEYGRLTGNITFISAIPNDDKKYVATVSLSDKQVTDYGKKLKFSNGLTANAEIIIDKKRLIYKFIYTLKYILYRSK